MLQSLRSALANTHADKAVHSEFWKFVGYATATSVMAKQGWMAQANWPFVTLFVAYLAIIAGSNVAVRILAFLSNNHTGG